MDIIFNGEIYNYMELRKELEARRRALPLDLRHRGPACGLGALGRGRTRPADRNVCLRHRRLARAAVTLVRDCFGIKPLYYFVWPQGFAFASEVKALLPLASRQVAAQPLYQYLMYGLTDIGGETLFADVRQLPPATVMEVEFDEASPPAERRYWRLPDGGGRRDRVSTRRPASSANILVDSVRLHLRSDVPVGACLSGGIDSSAIVMTMRAVGGENVDLHTFTYAAAWHPPQRGRLRRCGRRGSRRDHAQGAA